MLVKRDLREATDRANAAKEKLMTPPTSSEIAAMMDDSESAFRYLKNVMEICAAEKHLKNMLARYDEINERLIKVTGE